MKLMYCQKSPTLSRSIRRKRPLSTDISMALVCVSDETVKGIYNKIDKEVKKEEINRVCFKSVYYLQFFQDVACIWSNHINILDIFSEFTALPICQ